MEFLRGAFGVILGFLAMAVVVMITTPIAMALFVPGGLRGAMQGANQSSPRGLPRAYLTANLLFGLGAAVTGGYVCVWIARSALWPTVSLAVLCLIMARVSHVMAMKSRSRNQPAWYPVTIALAGSVGIVLGGLLKAGM